MVEKTTYNSRFTCPDMEEIDHEALYAFTINKSGEPLNFVSDYDAYVNLLSQQLSVCTEFHLYPEYSVNSRLHFHGTFKFRSALHVPIFYSMLHGMQFWSSYAIKEITNPDDWFRYYSKQSRFMQLLCEKYKRPWELTHEYVRKNSTKGQFKAGAFGEKDEIVSPLDHY